MREDNSGVIYVDEVSEAMALLPALRPLQTLSMSAMPINPSIKHALDRFVASDLGMIWSHTSSSTTDGLRIGDYGHFELCEDGARRFVRLGHVEELMGVPLSVGRWWQTRDARGIWSDFREWENDERMRWVP